jgi:hypothetical protein
VVRTMKGHHGGARKRASGPAHPDACRGGGGRLAAAGVLGLLLAATASPVAGAPGGGLVVIHETATSSGLNAVVAVPLALSGITVPTTSWSAAVSGRSVPLTTSHLAGPRLQVVLVLEQSRLVLSAEQGAAAEFLHQFPASSPDSVADGRAIVGTTRDTALAAIGRLRVAGGLPGALSAAIRAPSAGIRRAIVVFARCSSVAKAIGGLPPSGPSQELDLVGSGSGCPLLAAQIEARDGLVAIGHGSGDGLTAAADQIVHRLLGEYDINVSSSTAPDLTLTVRAEGMRLSSRLVRPGLTGVNRATARNSNSLAVTMKGIAIALVLMVGAALVLSGRRHVTG